MKEKKTYSVSDVEKIKKKLKRGDMLTIALVAPALSEREERYTRVRQVFHFFQRKDRTEVLNKALTLIKARELKD